MRQVLLLRAINLGARNRIAMAALRQTLTSAGLQDVQTYLGSGNVVLSSDAPPEKLAPECERLIADQFGFEVPVLVRSADELAQIVERNPLRAVAVNPKRYQVSFMSAELDPKVVAELQPHVAEDEQLVVIGRELYAWHPDGIRTSPLWTRLAGGKLGVTATARNWSTVTTLLALARG